MEPLALSGNYRLAASILVGMAFGFLLVKSDLAWRKTTLNMLLLKDGRLIKTLLFSLAVGATLFFFAYNVDLVHLKIRPGYFWASLIGGIITGLGLAFCCRVPITAIASLASGRVYALWTIIGMLLAVPFVKVISGWLSNSIYNWSEPLNAHEPITEYLNVSNPALWISAISLVVLVFVHFTLGGDEE
ncbi:YeeE/YedE thiosulfate transporter family protein [Lentisphaerota bacterium ZTH]|nr:YeeE/YedE family protein [Lentisphaerota bacterium]WET06625.1 YeeE/YedE thiosulfate transporter family protein [Lentisphaerota bacterium ZTH]